MRIHTATLLTAFLSSPLWAGSIISNIGSPIGGQTNIFGAQAVTAGFTMNAGSNFSLDAIQVTFNNNSGSAIAGSLVNAGLFADSAGNPTGSALVSLTFGTIAAGTGFTVTATPNSPFTLTAGTTYWLVLNSPTTNNGPLWDNAANNTAATGTGATFAGAGVGSMTSPTQINTFNASPSGAPFLFEVDATVATASATPEPASLALVAVALGLSAFRRRRSL